MEIKIDKEWIVTEDSATKELLGRPLIFMGFDFDGFCILGSSFHIYFDSYTNAVNFRPIHTSNKKIYQNIINFEKEISNYIYPRIKFVGRYKKHHPRMVKSDHTMVIWDMTKSSEQLSDVMIMCRTTTL